MMELQLAIATFMRRFEFELVDTTRDNDVDCVRDVFLTGMRPGSRGVKARVVGLRK